MFCQLYSYISSENQYCRFSFLNYQNLESGLIYADAAFGLDCNNSLNACSLEVDVIKTGIRVD